MKTKTEKKVATPAIVSGAGYKELFRGDYKTSEISIASNFRKTFNEKALQELAENIGKVGVLQPVILRMDGKGKYPVLVAGERRYRAAMLAGLKTIPGRILDLTEEQALEVQALENLHRKDLSPIEEARAFKCLLDSKGHGVDQAQELADRVGKNVSYIYRSVRLLELPKDVIEKIESGEWTPAHGHQLLRVPAEKVKDVIKEARNWEGNPTTANDIRKTIENSFGRNLHNYKFPKDIQYAAREACTGCAANSGNQGVLFDGAKAGRCTFRECLDAKQEQFVQDKTAEMAKKYGDRFLGLLKESIWHDNRLKNGMVALCKLGEKRPCVTKEQRENASYVLESDLTVWLVGEKSKVRSSGSSDGYGHTTPKQKFLRMETYKALFVAARATLSKGLQNEHYTAIAKQMQPGQTNPKIPMEMLNVQLKKSQYAWERNYAYDLLTSDELRDLVLLLALNNRCSTGQDPDPKIFAAVGVNTKLTIEAAKKKATAEWDAKKGAKKSKSAKQDRDADSSGNDAGGDE